MVTVEVNGRVNGWNGLSGWRRTPFTFVQGKQSCDAAFARNFFCGFVDSFVVLSLWVHYEL